jgi:hypothetical protein
MGSVDASELLDLWERAGALGPVERALALGEAAGADREVLVESPYGRTNEWVVSLREAILGTELAATASCPGCGARVEFAVDAASLRAVPREAGQPLTLEGYVVDWRTPTPADLLAAQGQERELLRRCVTVTGADGAGVDPAELPDALRAAVDDAMARCDPLAEVLLDLTCPDCGTDFRSDLDLGAFVWAEVEARARRVLQEVDLLARAYGWTEAEVLGLTEGRRATYLRMVTEGQA